MKYLSAVLIIMLTLSLKVNSQEFYMCEYVDDNWNPVGASASMNGSGGVNFLVKLPEKVYDQLYLWSIYKTDDSGKDTEFAGEYVMRIEEGYEIVHNGARFFCTTEKIYLQPGSYRIYFMYENDKETNFKYGNLTKYLAKGEVIIN
ncbi:MAG TPA: hypothetical protein PK605_01180 [Ignavibacteria bacterium]|nr:hypothetical protein [Ignavibacteria bacterium]HRF65512.1 hypothetical protein [Ignavibacteria bacterium]HRJ02993.1 hypothetical protein [Ignavibacteria bacterium]HRJ84902.1 hypothetical protein [Ignavibacteria bacterium]